MNILTIIQAISPLATPLVVVVLGLRINKQLEQSKLSLSKEKEWQTKWADSFFSSASAFNQAVEESIFFLSEVSRAPSNDLSEETKEKIKGVWTAIGRIKRTQISLETYAQFATKNSAEVLRNALVIMELISQILKDEQGDLTPVRQAQYKFNAASKAAHRELLAFDGY